MDSSFSYSSIKSMLVQARGSLNTRLSEFEPLVLLLAPLLTLFLAQIIGSVFGVVHEKGLKASLIGFVMGFLKMIPGVQNYIDAEKQKDRYVNPARQLLAKKKP